MAYLGIFRMVSQETMVRFENSTLEFFKVQNFIGNERILTLGSKVPYLDFLG